MKLYKGRKKVNDTFKANKIITDGENEWKILYDNLVLNGFFHIGERNYGRIFLINRRRRTFETVTIDQAKRWRI